MAHCSLPCRSSRSRFRPAVSSVYTRFSRPAWAGIVPQPFKVAVASLIIGALAVFLGGWVQGCIGFGFAIVVAPFLLMHLPPTTVVPMICMLSLLNTSTAALHSRKHLVPGLVLPLVMGGLLGLPAGVALLTRLDGPLLKTLIGIMLVVMATALLMGWSRPVQKQRAALFFVGIVSGFLSGSTSLTGPPVILFLSSQNTPKDVFRANILAYFALASTGALSLFLLNGLLTRETVLSAALYAPIILVASYAGTKSSAYVSEAAFKRLAMGCAAVMGAVLVAQNIGSAI